MSTTESESVHVSLARGIEVDISTTDRTPVFYGTMPQVPSIGETVWLWGGARYAVTAVEWNIGRDKEISAELTVEAAEPLR